MTNDATNAIAAAPTTRSPNAGVGIGPLVATAALAGTCWDSTALSLLCGDLISYSFGRRQRNLVHGHSSACSASQSAGGITKGCGGGAGGGSSLCTAHSP